MKSLPVRLIYGQKVVSDHIKLNRFAMPIMKINEDEKDRKVLKSETFNKLRVLCEQRPSLCNQAFTKEFVHLPESLTKDGEMSHSTKFQALKICYVFYAFLSRNIPRQLIQSYSMDWTDVYDTHNIEHRTEPVGH